MSLEVVPFCHIRAVANPVGDNVNGKLFNQLSLPTRTKILEYAWPRFETRSADDPVSLGSEITPLAQDGKHESLVRIGIGKCILEEGDQLRKEWHSALTLALDVLCLWALHRESVSFEPPKILPCHSL